MSTSTPDTLEMAQMPPSLARSRSRSTSPASDTTTLVHKNSNMRSAGFSWPGRDGSIGSGGTVRVHQEDVDALDQETLLGDDYQDLERNASATDPQPEAAVAKKSDFWQLVVFSTVLYSGYIAFLVYMIPIKLFPAFTVFGSPGPPRDRIRFAGAVHATADGHGLYVPSPALDRHGRRFTGPPSPAVDAAWHDLIYGRYVRLLPGEVTALNRASGVPALTPLPITDYLASPESDGNNDTVLVPQEGFYGGPDMLHSLHCIHTLYKHFNPAYYGDTLSQPFERLHIDHCLDQLRQAVLCHGDMTPVTLRPVRDARGEQWALLGETKRKHTCRDGEALGRKWREKGEERGRVESE
ncbi:hypothetical protein LTR91_011512 [Friedmanniomyces endolithicus]|uniref:Uncharacterized protein n=1 Tax=Friedmanniomyces endolithicus TaxID=329885 RepID=A0AAN6KHG5_9PEZI|nr:hypothetical protein LTR57_006128 [Friedmanniomyces endolithicus]KAK0982486.1 hypothetical protein LTR91_011512 [Friedmanniomyces endolithicus]KAK0998797.1 hypothetical protein LTS01_005624 [Friedmanniomyces endolithicus]KAK1040904.1 hypothetical protein LTS16_010019 [Friedmanniomyces endolithicus]